jgi:hypothetical protein
MSNQRQEEEHNIYMKYFLYILQTKYFKCFVEIIPVIILIAVLIYIQSRYIILAINGSDAKAIIYKFDFSSSPTTKSEFHYYFCCKKIKYYGSFPYLKRHENLEIGDTIPIKFLESNPKVNEAFFKRSIYYKLSKYINP